MMHCEENGLWAGCGSVRGEHVSYFDRGRNDVQYSVSFPIISLIKYYCRTQASKPKDSVALVLLVKCTIIKAMSKVLGSR